MTKREASLQKRLHAAHTFIGGLKATAKDYGSAFSSEVHYDCAKFLKDNKPINEPKHTLIPAAKWKAVSRGALHAKMALRYAEQQANPANQLCGIEESQYFAWIRNKAREALAKMP